MVIFILFWWTVFAVAIGVAASRRFDRNGFGWFALAFLISPLLSFVFLMAAGPAVQSKLDWRHINWTGEEAKPPPPPRRSLSLLEEYKLFTGERRNLC